MHYFRCEPKSVNPRQELPRLADEPEDLDIYFVQKLQRLPNQAGLEKRALVERQLHASDAVSPQIASALHVPVVEDDGTEPYVKSAHSTETKNLQRCDFFFWKKLQFMPGATSDFCGGFFSVVI